MDTSTGQAGSDELPIGVMLAHPLDSFYAEMGMTLPPIQEIHGEEVPQPYKQLLVHEKDMTPTLEAYFQADIHLQLLGRRRRDDEYFREVILLLDGSNQPVEFGAIKIHLERYPASIQAEILDEQRPLGRLLQEFEVEHSSRPKAFFRIASDPFINQALNLKGAQVLYGRRNTLYNPEGLPLAEIVEILPPVTPRAEGVGRSASAK